MKFKDKIIKCDIEDLNKIKEEYLEKWINALLQRMKVDKSKIDKIIQNDPNYGKRAWRVDLFYNHGIEIIKHPDRVVITKHNSDTDSIILGEWKEPSVVRVKDGKERYCELHLNYWQIV